jgi:hypothetical protein
MKINLDDKVKERPLKKYPCKRNKGNHEWETPEVIFKAVSYVYFVPMGIMHSGQFTDKYKLKNVYVIVRTKTICKHCGKIETNFFREKL